MAHDSNIESHITEDHTKANFYHLFLNYKKTHTPIDMCTHTHHSLKYVEPYTQQKKQIGRRLGKAVCVHPV